MRGAPQQLFRLLSALYNTARMTDAWNQAWLVRHTEPASSTDPSMAVPSLLPRIVGQEGRCTLTSENLTQRTVRQKTLILGTSSQLTLLHCTERTKRKREPFSTVPFSRDPDFVDRPNISAWIYEKCAGPATRAALVGLGGAGYVNNRMAAVFRL